MNEATEAAGSTSVPSEQRYPFGGFVVAGTYRISTLLGSGGMGDVYEAEHVRLGSPVAVKLLRANALGDPRSVERFRHEARRIARVRSENIIKVFDYGELPDGTPYFVMERLFGEDLRMLLTREGPLPVRRAVALLLDVCRGLAVVHAAGLVHRDLKPANLFVETSANGAETCKVLDFGVAKAFTSETTRQGTVLGTVQYMAPEQLENAASATATADVYALGAILYECLTGKPVHAGQTLQEMMFAVLHREPTPPSEFRDLPAELEAAVLRALSKHTARRFSDAREFARALSEFGPLDRRPKLVESVDQDTWSDRAALSDTPSRASRLGPSKLVLSLSALALGTLSGWFARGSNAPAPRMDTPPETRAAPVLSTSTALPSPRPRLAVDSQVVQDEGGTVVLGVPESSRPATSVRSRPPAKRIPVVPPTTQPLTSITDRFDSNDPYE
ncbi:MAG TPA: protein kinase [Polyangiaceae bacterium]